MVKITADLVARAPVVYTPLGDRELRLRGLKIPNIRNIGVTMDQFDAIDLSSNEVQTLGNFPKQLRLQSVLLNDNSVSRVEGAGMATALPNLKRLVLTGNRLARFEDIDELAHLTSLEFLSLEENPVTMLKGYRAYVVAHMPQLRVLDFAKVTESERAGATAASALAKSADGVGGSSDSDNSSNIRNGGNNTSSSGGRSTGGAAGATGDGGASKLTEAQIAALKDAAAKAKTKEELVALLAALETGVLPEGF
jgi:U2 small nuclear ribonucleoprotein A'